MKFQKTTSMILATAAVLSMASCGTKKEANGEKTLTWLLPGAAQADMATVQEKVNEITMEKLGTKVEIQFIDTGAFSEKMQMNMASGLDFDICFAGFVNNYGSAIEKGGVMDITELLDTVPTLKESIPDYAWEAASYNGRIYAVPNLQIYATAFGFTTTKELADKYGFDFEGIETIRDMEPYFETIKQNEPDITPYRANSGLMPWYKSSYETLSGFLALPKGATSADDLCFLQDTPEFQEGAAKMHEFYEKGYIRSDILSKGDDTSDYKNGKYAFSETVCKPGADVDEKTYIGGKDVVIHPYEKPFMDRSSATATMACIGKNSKNPELALKFLELINTDKELYNLVCYGIEGKHYNLDSDGKVEWVDDSGYQPNMSWAFGNQFNAVPIQGQDIDIWEQTEKINNEAGKSSLLGFVLDKSAIRTELTNIATVQSEYQQQYECGVKAPEEYMDEFRSKLKTAGQDKVYEEVKRQLTEYFASK